MLPPGRLPAAAGRSIHHDLQIAEELMVAPERPFVAALGGAKPAARLHGLRGLVLRADRVLVGGALSLPVLEAVGRAAGSAPPEFMEECRTLVGLAGRVQHPLELPGDLTVRNPDGSVEVVDRYDDLKGEIVDVGPATATRFRENVEGAGTVLWSGALGRAEDARFAAGTLEVARGLAGSPLRRIVIGGDCLASVLHQNGRLGPNLSLVSATDPLLELLKNGDLPALAALRSSSSQ
jgi:phosphoglycerate kinase